MLQNMGRLWHEHLRALRVALGFLTTLPLPALTDWHKDDIRLAVKAYPWVGLVMGTMLGVAAWLLLGVPDLVRGVLLAALGLGLSGALHFDGFCDIADAALGSKPLQERWRIAKDPHIGSFALAAGALLICLRIALYASAPILAIVAAPIVARTLIVLVMAHYPLYQASQLGRASQITWREVGWPCGVGIGLLGGLVMAGLGWRLGVMLGVSVVWAWLVAHMLMRRMQGLGGDAYGAVIETVEVVSLVGVVE